MDIHRCRFVPYNPQAINTLAFSHPPSADTPGRGIPTLRLAVGRANGDIEIWNPLRGAWFQETILRGGKDRSIEGLAWTLDPSEDEGGDSKGKLPGKLRLFSVGYSSAVTEWDLQTGRPAQHSSGNYGEIWCLTAQPRWKATKRGKDGKLLPPAEGEYTGQHLAVGCADGSIVILSTEDGDLRYLRTLRPSTKHARVLSIAFQDRNVVVAGYADSCIRLFDLRNGRLLRTMSLGKGPAGGPKEILVWSVKCLPDGTIVSGDSTGEIRFWDGKNFAIFQRLTSHLADVLDIVVSADGKSIVSGGADQRTAIYRLKDAGKGDMKRRWAELTHRRYHTHDVKALAVYETKDISIVVSGGLDTTPVVLPLREYGNEHHRKLSSLPQLPQLVSSPSSRLVMSWWDREVSIWHVSRGPDAQDGVQDGRQHRLAGKILFKGEENLTSASLSSDGKLLVASTVSEVKIFSLKQRMGDVTANLKVQKLEIPSVLSAAGARLVSISPDNRWLCVVRPNSDIYVANITPATSPQERPQISSKLIKLKRVERHARHEKESHGTLGLYERSIRCIAFSGDSRILASGDLGGYVDSWVLEDCADGAKVTKTPKINGRSSSVSSDDDSSDDEDNPPVIQGQRWIRTPHESPIPRMKSGILFISFRPRNRTQVKALTNGDHTKSESPNQKAPSEDRLMVLTGEHQLAEFNTLQGKLSNWSRRNPKGYLPSEFTGVKDRAMGAVWDIKEDRERLWLYGPTWMWMFDLSQDFPPPEEGDGAKNDGDAAEPVAQIDNKPASSSNKRKREKEIEDVQDRKKLNTGAGDRIPLLKSDVGLGEKMRKITGKDESNVEVVSLRGKPSRSKKTGDDDDEGDYDDETSIANELTLAKLRREQISGKHEDDDDDEDDKQRTLTNGTGLPFKSRNGASFAVVIDNKAESGETRIVVNGQQDLDIQEEPEAEPDTELQAQPKRRWWSTYKYREILGIVPLSSHDNQPPTDGSGELDNALVTTSGAAGDDESGIGLEVAVVERPMWDVDLPGRYVRDYE